MSQLTLEYLILIIFIEFCSKTTSQITIQDRTTHVVLDATNDTQSGLNATIPTLEYNYTQVYTENSLNEDVTNQEPWNVTNMSGSTSVILADNAHYNQTDKFSDLVSTVMGDLTEGEEMTTERFGMLSPHERLVYLGVTGDSPFFLVGATLKTVAFQNVTNSDSDTYRSVSESFSSQLEATLRNISKTDNISSEFRNFIKATEGSKAIAVASLKGNLVSIEEELKKTLEQGIESLQSGQFGPVSESSIYWYVPCAEKNKYEILFQVTNLNFNTALQESSSNEFKDYEQKIVTEIGPVFQALLNGSCDGFRIGEFLLNSVAAIISCNRPTEVSGILSAVKEKLSGETIANFKVEGEPKISELKYELVDFSHGDERKSNTTTTAEGSGQESTTSFTSEQEDNETTTNKVIISAGKVKETKDYPNYFMTVTVPALIGLMSIALICILCTIRCDTCSDKPKEAL